MLEVLTPPTTDIGPVSLDRAKTYLRIDHADDDQFIRDLLRAGTEDAQTYTSRQFLDATYRQTYDGWPLRDNRHGRIRMLRPARAPMIQVTALQYLDPTDTTLATWLTVAATDYRVDTISEPGRITEQHGVSWPDPADAPSSVRVVWDAGYSGSVPVAIENAILFYVAYRYADRHCQGSPEQFYRALDRWIVHNTDYMRSD